jgi:plastocyanin
MRKTWLLVGVVFAVVLLVGARGESRAAFAQEPATVEARAGAGAPGYSVNLFLPETVTVHVGDTVRWEFAWLEPHTVSFGERDIGVPESTPSPAVYDGTGFVTSDVIFGAGPTYEVQFVTEGTYIVHCEIHYDMKGTVHVVGADQAVDSQAEIDIRGDEEFDAALTELQTLAAAKAALPEQRIPLAGGATEHVVAVAFETASGYVQQYFPPDITVELGDTVTWRSTVEAPHTVTLGPIPTGIPRPGNPQVDTVVRPGDDYDGTGFWNSGPIGRDWPAGTTFQLTFVTEGTFDYYCILHRTQGHVGTITVVDSSAPGEATPTPSPSPTVTPPLPPATGSGVEQGGPGMAEFMGALLAVFGAALLMFGGRRLAR